MRELLRHARDKTEKEEELQRTEYYPVRLAIYGTPGTGQSGLAKELKRRSGIQLHRAGEERRERVREETGEEIIGHHPIDVEGNINIDSDVKKWLLEATEGNKIIIDAKLSNVIAREIQEESIQRGEEPPKFTGILVVARADVRYRRIRERQIRNQMKKTGLSKEEVERDPQFSLKAIKKATIEREQGDLEGWRLNHPQLVGIDPFNPANKDNKGNKIFDFYINTSELSVAEGADLIEVILKRRYLEMQRKNRKERDLPQNGVIFQA